MQKSFVRLVHTPALLVRSCINTHRTAIVPVCTKQIGEAALMDSVTTDTVDCYLIYPRPPRATFTTIPDRSVRCDILPWDPPVWEYRRSSGWAHPCRHQSSTNEGLGGSLKERKTMTITQGCKRKSWLIWKREYNKELIIVYLLWCLDIVSCLAHKLAVFLVQGFRLEQGEPSHPETTQNSGDHGMDVFPETQYISVKP